MIDLGFQRIAQVVWNICAPLDPQFDLTAWRSVEAKIDLCTQGSLQKEAFIGTDSLLCFGCVHVGQSLACRVKRIIIDVRFVGIA